MAHPRWSLGSCGAFGRRHTSLTLLLNHTEWIKVAYSTEYNEYAHHHITDDWGRRNARNVNVARQMKECAEYKSRLEVITLQFRVWAAPRASLDAQGCIIFIPFWNDSTLSFELSNFETLERSFLSSCIFLLSVWRNELRLREIPSSYAQNFHRWIEHEHDDVANHDDVRMAFYQEWREFHATCSVILKPWTPREYRIRRRSLVGITR